MMMKKAAQLWLVSSAIVAPEVNAVLYGDEIYQDVLGGKFWTFYREGVAIIDPESCTIETTISNDVNGAPLPAAFNDAVYMQSKDDTQGYVLIGSRVDETNDVGDTISHMYAFSTSDRTAIAKSEVGSRVVHSYGVWPQNELWMHSDGNGLYYVFDVDDLSKVAHDHNIEAKVTTPSHGKLLWDESSTLQNRGFDTSTGEQYLIELDMDTKEQIGAFNYSVFAENGQIEGCRGLHSIAYSSLNEHIYAECSGGGGALEFDVSNDSIQFVQQFKNANGALYETPDGRFVVAVSKGLNYYYVFVPQGTGSKSSVEYTIQMKGRPSTVSFYTNTDNDIIACSPMTENLNQNQRREDGSISCGYYEGCTGAVTADDVEAGICAHHEDDPLKLFRKSKTDIVNTHMCGRCQDPSNFDSINDETGEPECICTPHCGSCDPAPSYNDDDSGYMCHNLSRYVKAVDAGETPDEGTVIPNTGGMKQGSPYGSSAECTFGRTYRTHKRGMQYDAAVATAPTNSLVIIDMDTRTKKCTVELPEAPSKVLYAPDQPVDRMAAMTVMNNGNGNSAGSTSTIASTTTLMMTVGAVGSIIGGAAMV